MELPVFNTYINFSCHHLCFFIVAPLLVLDKSMAWNRCLQHPCFENLCKSAQAYKNSDSNAQHFLSDLLTHSWFHSMFFALPGYQFPCTVMNRCFYHMLPNTNMVVAANTLRMPLASRGSKRYIRSYNTNCTLCNPNSHILFKPPLLEVIKFRLKWIEMQATTNFIMPSCVDFSLMCTVKRQFLVLWSTPSSWPLQWCQRRHSRRFLK